MKHATLRVPLVVAVLAAAGGARADVAIAPGSDGSVGAWLVATAPAGSGATSPANEDAGGANAARIASSASGPVDVGAAVGAPKGRAYAVVSGVLRLTEPLRGTLLLGASDDVKVSIDGAPRFSRDGRRPERDDDAWIPLDLPAGDHPLSFELRHRSGPWLLHARLVDASLAPPAGASIVLPGTTEADARELAQKMARIEVDRGLSADGYRPRVTVEYPEGAPRDVPLAVRITVGAKNAAEALLRVAPGEVPIGPSGASELSALLPAFGVEELGGAKGGAITVEVAGKGTDFELHPNAALVEAMADADKALALAADEKSAPFLDDPAVTRATVEHLRDHLATYADRDDRDDRALADDAATLRAYRDDLENGRDPLRSHAGIRRFAYRSPLDGALQPFGVYVPPSYRPGGDRKYPLVVALHGMNGKPLSMIRWFFGRDDEAHGSEWEDRHPGDVDPIDAFVVAPNAHGNAMYRELGETDVMNVLAWAEKFFPIDARRVTITGVSMGGIGAAWIPLRFPDRFAAAAPLCGYHSYFIRRDLSGVKLRPWERLLAEHRSNVLWAENGQHLPLYVWHGKRDLPEENSGVLIDRYEALGYTIEHEHPDVGHDVWKKAYADRTVWRWLARYRVPSHPTRLVFKTDSLRYADDHWLHVRGLAKNLAFGEVRAHIRSKTKIAVETRGVTAIALDRDEEKVSTTEPVRVTIDGDELTFAEGTPIAAHRADAHWVAGPLERAAGSKRPGLSGPIRDVFHEPLVFVVGTRDPASTRANLAVARHLATVRFGVDVAYPIVGDDDLDDATAASHSLVLLGDAKSNRLVRDLEHDFPFRIEGGAVVAGEHRYAGDQVGVAFVRPNPRHPDRYVLVVEGTSPLGMLRATSLPDLLPDWIVWDRSLEASRHSLVLGAAKPLAAGMFRDDWTVDPAALP